MHEVEPRDRFLDLALALSDGQAVDWDQEGASAASADEVALVRNLAVVDRLARLTRERARLAEDPPPVWKHFLLVRRLAAGPGGEVHLAWDSRLQREVALKLLPPDDGSRTGDDLIADARRLARVRHPNLVTVYGAARGEGRAGIWMELAEGQTLDHWRRRHGPPGPVELALIGLDVCRGLDALRGAGVRRRDLRLRNLLRRDDGRVVVMLPSPAVRLDDWREPTPAPAGLGADDVTRVARVLVELGLGGAPEGDMGSGVPPALRRRLTADLSGILERALHPASADRYDSTVALGEALAAIVPKSV